MDSNLLAGAVDYVLREDLRVHSMTLVRNGYIVLDAYFRPYAAGIPHEVASTTKSFTSTLIGIAIDRELIAGVGEPIFKLLGKEVDAQKAAVRLEDVLTMRSGLTCIWDITAVNTFEFRSSPDWMAFIMKFPAVKPAGEHYCYSNADSHILSAVIS
jgi:CubicO group peptidase (beta-lactamase class C family)